MLAASRFLHTYWLLRLQLQTCMLANSGMLTLLTYQLVAKTTATNMLLLAELNSTHIPADC